MKTFVLGDIHGAYRALIQVFKRSGFDAQKDRLIFLGDVVDGWSQVPESIEELMRVKNLIHLLGNHDNWALDWMLEGFRPDIWIEQGGLSTMQAYASREWRAKKKEHRDFLRKARLKFLDEENRLYVHAGIDIMKSLDEQKASYLIWDRMLFDWTEGVPDYREIFIGHTVTLTEDTDKPLHFGEKDNIWRLDTGAGYYGKLTIMDVETKDYWQSDPVTELYPDEPGRKG
ncbi:MAG: metallophosphoesterase [Thermoleophilia bacterium]|nr:metallophosphoesterase [Thermoleophilia bacterium]